MDKLYSNEATFSTVTVSGVEPNILSKFKGDDLVPTFETVVSNPIEGITDYVNGIPLWGKAFAILLGAGILINFVYPMMKSRRK